MITPRLQTQICRARHALVRERMFTDVCRRGAPHPQTPYYAAALARSSTRAEAAILALTIAAAVEVILQMTSAARRLFEAATGQDA